MKTLHFPSLNGIRALSIFLVIAHHGFNQDYDGSKYITDNRYLQVLTTFLIDGQLGVTIFFVLSGFLNTALLLREEQENKSISVKHFYFRRICKIFPSYYFLLLVYAALDFIGFLWFSDESWFTSLTFTKTFNYSRDWFTGHLWSISVEMQYYLLWPLIFILGDKIRKTFLFTLIVAIPFVRLYFWYYPNDWIGGLSIFTRFDAIASGCLFAIYRNEILKWVKPYQTTLFFAACLCVAGMSYIGTMPYANDTNMYQSIGTSHGTLVNFSIVMVLLYSVFGPQNIWYKILNSKVLNYIGLISFSLYLWQQFFLNSEGYWFCDFPFNVLFAFGAAMLSYHCIEKPFLKFKSK